MRFLLPLLPMLLFAAEKDGGAGGSTKPASLDAQLTASQTRVTELEALQSGWTNERATLTTERDTANSRVTELTSQLSAATAEHSRLTGLNTGLQTQLTTANGTITTLTAERDRFKTLSETPSAQAQGILAQAGGAAVAMRPDGTKHPAETTVTPAANLAGKTGLARAMAKNVAKAAAAKA